MFQRKTECTQNLRRPILLAFRSSKYYLAATAGLGLVTDLSLHAIYVPAIPFRLEALGYSNVPSLTGWLAAAYAGGLIVATFPFSWIGSRYKSKRVPLLGALALLSIAILIFLFVPHISAMIIARVLQGMSGSGIWTLGLALVADNVEANILGRMMGLTLLGYSIGTTIGQPLGGVLYARHGWAAPSVFALGLIAIDFVMRLAVLEKHEIVMWIEAEPDSPSIPTVSILLHDAAQSTQDLQSVLTRGTSISTFQTEQEKKDVHRYAAEIERQGIHADLEQVRPTKGYSSLRSMFYLLSTMRPMSGLLLTFVNGILTSGIYDTALVLRLNQRYGLNAMQAGLVYLAIVIPAAFISPLSGHLTDKFGPRPLVMICCLAYVPALSLLAIDKLPLAGFIAIFCFCGASNGLINSPIMVFLARTVEESEGRITTSHVYGGFNLFFSLGAFIGPIMSGEILGHVGVATGWHVVVCTVAGMVAAMAPFIWIYMRTLSIPTVRTP